MLPKIKIKTLYFSLRVEANFFVKLTMIEPEETIQLRDGAEFDLLH
jgi:hypothetical protein